MDRVSEIAKTASDTGGEVFNASCFVKIDGKLVKVGLGVTSPLISCLNFLRCVED